MNSFKLLPFAFRKIRSIDRYLITNHTGSYVFLETYKQLESLASEHFDQLEDATIDQLLANNIIAEKVEYENKIKILTTNLATRINHSLYGSILVLIIPTLRCDHDCGYCQVSRVSTTAIGYDAMISDIEKTIQFLKNLNTSSLKIEFQGGEPLLNFEYIKLFYSMAIRILGIETSFVICSALGPLNDEVIDWIDGKNITFSTSLDGGHSVHSTNRMSKYFNSYEKTVSGIKKIQSKLGRESVNALATITKTAMFDPKSIIDTYIDLGLNSIFIRPLSPLGFAYNHVAINYTPNDFMSFYKSCLEYIFLINERSIFVEETALIYFKKILSPVFTDYVDLQSPSGYLLNALVVNYDGNIFGSDETRMLWEMTRNDELVSGSIKTDKFLTIKESNINLLADSFLSEQAGCESCAYQSYCGSDPLYHLTMQGDHVGNKAKSDYCRLQLLLFDHFFELLQDESKREIISTWLK